LKHNCPTNMVWSPEKGKCIQPDLEKKHKDCSQLDVDLNRCIPEAVPENPNDRSKAQSPLNFKTHLKRGDIKKI